MKQTALEWLLSKIYIHIRDKEWIEQAKKMEKEQIIEAHGSKLISPKGLASEYWVNGEEYYNKTFNKGQ
jgi:hypothetical protein